MDYNGTCSNPAYGVPSTYTESMVGWTCQRGMSDVVVPGFRSLSRRGRIFNYPMSKTETIQTESIASWSLLRTSYANTWCTTPPPSNYRKLTRGFTWVGSRAAKYLCSQNGSGVILFATAPEIDSEWLESLAVTTAFSNVEYSEVLAAVSLAESEKTIKQIVSIFRRLFKYVRLARKVQLLQIWKKIKKIDALDLWMEIRFGLRPLMYDLIGAVKALNAYNPPNRETFRGTEIASVSNSNVYNYSDNIGGHTISSNVQKTVEVRAGVLVRFDAISKLNVIGLDEVLETAYELIPLSWLFDYFFNTGKVIASWTPEQGVTNLASWSVVKTTEHHVVTAHDGWNNTNFPNMLQNSRVIENATVERISTSTVRTPSPSRSILPRWKLRIDASKLIDVIGVMRSLLQVKTGHRNLRM